MIARTIPVIVFFTGIAAAALPETDKMVEELSATHAKLPGFVATWHAEGKEKSLDLTIAMDRNTGRFASHLLATSPQGKLDARQWSPDGRVFYIDQNGSRARVDSLGAELNFFRSFGDVFLDKKVFDAFTFYCTPAMPLRPSTIELSLQIENKGRPGWTLIEPSFKTTATSDETVTLSSEKFGQVTIDRANGILLRQEIKEGEVKRVLERTSCTTEGIADEITKLTKDWSTLGAEDPEFSPWSLKFRMVFFQFVIDGIENGSGSLEKLEEKLARKDELLDYGRRALIKSKRPTGETNFWEKVLTGTRTEARKRWKEALPEGEADDDKAFAKYLAIPANRTGIRDIMADAMSADKRLAPAIASSLYGPAIDEGLVTKSAPGRIAKSSIETALCRAFLAAMLEEKMAAAWGERENMD
ncbi:MAG: hypothetical protein EOP83_07475 [Verrucomicrobiaceae bacterium]|nr:MAG: hypothetical protein EOP83_07475 [Verrucomicrobiaceae bacterium]